MTCSITTLDVKVLVEFNAEETFGATVGKGRITTSNLDLIKVPPKFSFNFCPTLQWHCRFPHERLVNNTTLNRGLCRAVHVDVNGPHDWVSIPAHCFIPPLVPRRSVDRCRWGGHWRTAFENNQASQVKPGLSVHRDERAWLCLAEELGEYDPKRAPTNDVRHSYFPFHTSYI